MRIVIQRVKHASVNIDGATAGHIGKGLLVLLGIVAEDSQEDIDWIVRKLCALRVFDDAQGVMNLNVQDVGGEVMVISQFTLMASTRKGNRPSYIRAAPPDIAIPLYEAFVRTLQSALGMPVPTGEFGADMQVELLNDGPVTIIIDSKTRE